jgi:cytoskeletal protein CcmA (bactofilin family)
MNASVHLWSVAFFVLTAALLALPFYPAWQEWRHPLDALALALKTSPSHHGLHTSPQVRLARGVATPPVVSASVRILASTGSQFQKLTAPTIVLGSANTDRPGHEPPRRTLLTPPHAQAWGDRGWRIQGDCHIPDAQQVQGPLVVMGALTLGADCVIDGDIKAHGAVQVGPRSRIRGALFSEQAIALHEDVQVQGPVVSEVQVDLAPGVVMGRLAQPSTLRAPRMVARSGAVVHGTVWATQSGRVL